MMVSLLRPAGRRVPTSGIRHLLEVVRADELSGEVGGVVNHRRERDVAVVLLTRQHREVLRQDSLVAVWDAVLSEIARLHVRGRGLELSAARRALDPIDRHETRAARVDQRTTIHLPDRLRVALPRRLTDLRRQRAEA